MWENIVGQHIRRGSRNLIRVGAVLLLIGLGGLIYFKGWFYNAFKGPFHPDARTLASLSRPWAGKEFYVTVRGDSDPHSFGDEVETEEGSHRAVRTTASYYLMRVGGRLLPVKASTNATGRTFTGIYTETPEDIVGAFRTAPPRIQSAILPFMLDASSSFTGRTYLILAASVFFALIGALCARIGLSRMSDPSCHPSAKALAQYGEPFQVAHEIDSEVTSDPEKATLGSTVVTRRWLLQPRTYGLQVVRLEDLAWVYKQVLKHKQYGVITTNTDYFAMLNDRNGKLVQIQAKQKVVDQLVGEVARRAPWAVSGFSAEIQDLWQKDRPQFLAAVEERRRSAAQPGASTPG